MESVMTIAGSDPSGGAGIVADIKTFSALGVHPTCVITNITAQNDNKFISNVAVDGKMVTAQIDAVVACYNIKAVKIGMLFTKENLKAVKKAIVKHKLRNVVLDPLSRSSSGEPLAEYDIATLKKELFSHVDIITPNIKEAQTLADKNIVKPADLKEVALELASYGCESVVITGYNDGRHFVDMLYDGEDFKDYKMKRLKVPDLHGTGCTFSSAIAAFLALGRNLTMSVKEAKEFTFNAIKHAYTTDGERLVLNHFFMHNG